MAKIEVMEGTRKIDQTGAADLLIGISGTPEADRLRSLTERLISELSAAATRVVISYPGAESSNEPGQAVELLPYDLPAPAPGAGPWAEASNAHRALLTMAGGLGAKVCAVLSSDLLGLNAAAIQLLSYPILEKQCDLVMPLYPAAKFEGLLNSGILAPLTRALYGKRVRYPLAADFSCSGPMAATLIQPGHTHERGAQGPHLLWPTTLASARDAHVCQVHLAIQHAAQTDGLELSDVLAQLVGSAFGEMEQYAAQWQRVRGSQPTDVWGSAVSAIDHGETVDVRPMMESFQLGARNLQELWNLVLPPVTLLELRRLARLPAEQFRMPDELWVRIVYDFALAHRLRSISRTHLLGALTPLYLGWVASYAQEVGGLPQGAAEQRLERLAKAYEDGKPYLVSRWRWPDRFNP